jgi:methyltransferase (TIGR00027 family)
MSTAMGAAPISRTALFVAVGRAIGAREPDPAARNPDHIAERLLGDVSALDVDHPVVLALGLDYSEAMQQLEVVNNVRIMTVRTRFVDEALERAITQGAIQVVVLGAGVDTRAYRCRELLADATVFEVDRPETQDWKKERVKEVLGGFPKNLTYVPVDFRREDLRAAIEQHGYDASQQTFFIMEGVTMYVPEESVRDTFRFVAAHPSGSGIMFDYVYRPMVDMINRLDMANMPEFAKPMFTRFQNLIRDEQWVFGFPMSGEREFPAELGLEIQEALTIGGEESIARYLTRSDGTQVGAEVLAAAMERMAELAQAADSDRSRERPPIERMREMQRIMAYQLADAVVA